MKSRGMPRGYSVFWKSTKSHVQQCRRQKKFSPAAGFRPCPPSFTRNVFLWRVTAPPIEIPGYATAQVNMWSTKTEQYLCVTFIHNSWTNWTLRNWCRNLFHEKTSGWQLLEGWIKLGYPLLAEAVPIFMSSVYWVYYTYFGVVDLSIWLEVRSFYWSE
jgi:hypothetical protein